MHKCCPEATCSSQHAGMGACAQDSKDQLGSQQRSALEKNFLTLHRCPCKRHNCRGANTARPPPPLFRSILPCLVQREISSRSEASTKSSQKPGPFAATLFSFHCNNCQCSCLSRQLTSLCLHSFFSRDASCLACFFIIIILHLIKQRLCTEPWSLHPSFRPRAACLLSFLPQAS